MINKMVGCCKDCLSPVDSGGYCVRCGEFVKESHRILVSRPTPPLTQTVRRLVPARSKTMKCHICDNPKVNELETVMHSDGVMKAYYCKAGCGCRVAAQQSVHPTLLESPKITVYCLHCGRSSEINLPTPAVDGAYCACNPNEAPYKIGSNLCAVCEKPRR